jgi:serpin B
VLKIAIVFAVIAAIPATVALAADSSPVVPILPIIDAQNAFGFSLYSQIKNQPGNLFFAPQNIHIALAMLFTGAAGRTAAQMADVMKLPDSLHGPALAAALEPLISQMQKQSGDPDFTLRSANSVWAQKGLNWSSAYTTSIKNDFHGQLNLLDFANAADALKIINGWVDQQTDNKIQNLFSPASLTPQTRMVLASAVHFKADWKQPFETTQDADFYTPGSADPNSVPTMNLGGQMNYLADSAMQAVQLPYKGGKYAMLFLLPDDRNGLAKLESDLSPDRLTKIAAGLTAQQVRVYIPRFKFSAELQLGATLSNMGMTDAFVPPNAVLPPGPDFSPMDGQRDLFVSAAIHKAFVAVDEKGTEAAAATGIVMRPTAIMRRLEFRADHPFIFLIRDTTTGSILFMGRILDPR